jgi:hypothetical protein
VWKNVLKHEIIGGRNMPKIVNGKLVADLDLEYLLSDDWGFYFDREDLTREELKIELEEELEQLRLRREKEGREYYKKTPEERKEESRKSNQDARDYALYLKADKDGVFTKDELGSDWFYMMDYAETGQYTRLVLDGREKNAEALAQIKAKAEKDLIEYEERKAKWMEEWKKKNKI